MSRDWMPVEQYAVDKQFKEERGAGLRDAVITYRTPDGKELPMRNEKMREQFPELEFLWSESKAIFEKYQDNKVVLSILNELEEALRDAEKTFDETKRVPEGKGFWMLDTDEFAQLPLNEVVGEWFNGNLDSSFYYNEWNNQMLGDFVKIKISEALNAAKEEKMYKRRWKPSKTAMKEFSDKMQEIDEFCAANGIVQSRLSDSYYFELNGQKYRVSNHSVEASNSAAYDDFTYEKKREVYHKNGREEDTIYIHAGKTRIIEIYTDLKNGYELDGRGNRKEKPMPKSKRKEEYER